MKEIIITKGFPLGSHTESRIKSRALDSARLQNPNNQKAQNLQSQNLQSQNPKAQKKARNLKNILVLGIGGNQGQILHTFFHLLVWFIRHRSFEIIQTTSIYKNPAFGYTHQSDFLNTVLALRTSLNLVEIFRLIFYLERKFGRPRKRVFKNAPRTLDIDVIFYNQVILKRPYFKIPHSEYQNRGSVLVPIILQIKRWK